MIARTFSIIAANWWFYLFFAAILVIVAGLVDAGYFKSGSGAATTVLWLIFARFVHSAALFGVKFGAGPDGTPDRSFGGFILRGLALLLISMILAAPFLIWAISAKAKTLAAVTIGDVYPVATAFLVIYAIVMSFAGSWLPASVYRQNMSLGAALKRGTSNFFSVFIRIAPTMLLAVIVEFAALIIFVIFHFDLSVVDNGTINPMGALAVFGIGLAETASVTLISVILSHYYLAYEKVDLPA